jgi:hypothetical protein
MTRGPKKGVKQSAEHIRNRIKNRKTWNGGHNQLTTETFLEKLLGKWPDCPYDLTQVNYIKNTVKITLICTKHGSFAKWPSDVLNRSGCPKCAGLVYDAPDIIATLSSMFPNYDYSNTVYLKSTAPMEVRCKIHDSLFFQTNYRKEECPACSKERRLKNRIASGRAKDPSTLTEFEKYKRAVWKETNKSYRKHKNVLGERNRLKHLDHIYSILHGFRDNIDPIILGNIVNLRIIDSKVNQSKNVKSGFSREELIKLYERALK